MLPIFKHAAQQSRNWFPAELTGVDKSNAASVPFQLASSTLPWLRLISTSSFLKPPFTAVIETSSPALLGIALCSNPTGTMRVIDSRVRHPRRCL